MAAFSYNHQTLHFDSVLYLQQSSQMRMSGGLLEEPNYPQFYQTESNVLESNCILDQSIKVTLSNPEPSLTNETFTDSSSVTDKIESGEQVTQKVPAAAMEKKRKTKEGPPVNSADRQSKGLRDHARGNSKKQKKCRKIMKDDEEKKPKEDEKDRKKAAVEAPTVYIHVRARRGQATDSHSLAERVRREKISERMKVLEALVPGCDKVTGKALMLDEIINYVQSLQHQVEFLSMKIASLNPMFYDFAMDLDSFMASPDQTLSNMASPTQNMQKSEPMQPSIISERNNNALRIAANNYSQLDSSASVLFQQHLNIPQILSQPDQANGQLLWDVDDQRQKLINQTGFTTNLCSFH